MTLRIFNPSHTASAIAAIMTAIIILLTACSGSSGSGDEPPGNTNTGGNNNPTSIPLGISWNPNADTVSGYRVYYGTDANNALPENLAAIKSIADSSFNPTSPTASIDAMAAPINASPGDQICFSVIAYNVTGSSPPSDGVCITL